MAGRAVGRYVVPEVILKILKLSRSTMHYMDPIRLARRCEVVWLLLWTFNNDLGSALVTYFEMYDARPVPVQYWTLQCPSHKRSSFAL
jgi:hypothetical protein